MDQSGTFPKKFSDFRQEDIDDKNLQSDKQMQQALAVECGVEVSSNHRLMWNLLGGLGSHDLSVMREALGMPTAVVGASLGFPFWKYVSQSHLYLYSLAKEQTVPFSNTLVSSLATSRALTRSPASTHI